MTVIYREGPFYRAYIKGAPDLILDLCDRIYLRGRIEPLSQDMREKIEQENEKMARQALRVLALAYREVDKKENLDSDEEIEKNLIFLGLAGMADPPRPEAEGAVKQALRAGIRVIMITGDHKVTAQAVAREVELEARDDQVVTGQELDGMKDSQLKVLLDRAQVFARVTPQHKLRLVRALKEKGHVVAMTGDGVNDAPAIKEADVGIAMGQGEQMWPGKLRTWCWRTTILPP